MQGSRRQRLAAILAVLAALLSASGCAPDSSVAAQPGRFVARRDSPASREAHQKILSQYGGVYGDHKLAAWLEAIGQRLAGQADHPDLHLTFVVLDSGVVNAFSTQAGTVYVTRGLLALAQSDAEIAAVLGHEIGHIVDRDRAAPDVPSPGPGDTGFLGDLPRREEGAPRAGFSQEQEYRADDFGVAMLRAGGYDPLAMARILTTIARDSELQARLTGRRAPENRPGYEGSHPLPRDRIARARQAGEAAKQLASAAIGRDTYLAAVDGMAFGESPDRGYVRQGLFVHPRAGFAFHAPDGFTLQGSATAVTATRADGSTFLLTSAPPGIAASPLDYLIAIWARDIVLDSPSPITINGRPAAFASAFVQSDQGPLDAYLLVIGWSPSLVYRLAFLTPPASADRAAAIFWPTANSFRALGPADIDQYPPLRLRVVVAGRHDTMASLSRRMATAEPKDERFRILNALQSSDPIRPGMRLKIAQ
jgi:predicted Zn-dependent protease